MNEDCWDSMGYLKYFTRLIYEIKIICNTDKPCLHLVNEMWDSVIHDLVHEILIAREGKSDTCLHCLSRSYKNTFLKCRRLHVIWINEEPARVARHRDGEFFGDKMKFFCRLFPNDSLIITI